jgi:hypothetical protein
MVGKAVETAAPLESDLGAAGERVHATAASSAHASLTMGPHLASCLGSRWHVGVVQNRPGSRSRK